MVSTEPSADTILEDVARIIAEEPERLGDISHNTQRTGIERIADIFTWEVPELNVSIIATVKVGSSTYTKGRCIAEVFLGAIRVIHGNTEYKVGHLRALDKQMLNFSWFNGSDVHGLAEAIRRIAEVRAATTER